MIADLLTVLVVGVTVTISATLYFLPSFVAAFRRAPDLGTVAVVNVLLGWTLLGWVLALALAFRSSRPASQVVQFVQNMPPSPAATGHTPIAPPANTAALPGWAGPAGPPPGRVDDAPPLFLPADTADLAGCYGPVGEE